MTKIGDVRAKSSDELNAMLLDLRKEQFNLRFQRATGQSEGVARVKIVRRDIARVKTVLHQTRTTSSKSGAAPAAAAKQS